MTKSRPNKQVVRLLRPRDARTLKQTCALQRDNYDTKNFWLLLNGGTISSPSVTICRQTAGEAPQQAIHIPRRVFDRLVDWYMTPQNVPTPKRGKRK